MGIANQDVAHAGLFLEVERTADQPLQFCEGYRCEGLVKREHRRLSGAQIGLDRQWRRFVVGLGVEGGVLDLDGTADVDSAGGGDGTSFETGAYVGITGRGGIAFDRLLVYGRGGIAFLDASASGFCDDPLCGSGGVETSESDVLLGHSVGGGLEYAFGRNWAAGAEYRFIHFFDDLQPQGGQGPGAPFWQNVKIDDIHTVRGHISYRW